MRDKRKSYTYSTRDRYSIAAARFIASHNDWIMALMRTGQELIFWRGPLSIAFITSITVPAPRRRTPSSNIFPMLFANFVILPLCGTVQPHLAIFTIKGSILVYMQHLLKWWWRWCLSQKGDARACAIFCQSMSMWLNVKCQILNIKYIIFGIWY